MTTTPRTYKTGEHAAKAWAKRNGWTANHGGWVFPPNGGSGVQGYYRLALRLVAKGTIVLIEPQKGVSWMPAYIVEG